jgi:micrococcal nuclease
MNPRTLRLALLALPAVLGAGWFWMSSAAPAPFTRGTVVRVIDGDTILVRGGGGRIEDIRLLGIDTPETVDPRKPVQCYGPQASAFAKHLETGRAVTLTYDRELHDRYGRFLHAALFAELERSAAVAGRGLWRACQ